MEKEAEESEETRKAMSRRKLLGLAAVTAAGLAATQLTGRAQAQSDQPLLIGKVNEAPDGARTVLHAKVYPAPDGSLTSAFTVENHAPYAPTSGLHEPVAIWGQCSNGRGVQGVSESGIGVLGHSDSFQGVAGVSPSGEGVAGSSVDGTGVHGHSDKSGTGVSGYSESGTGVHAKSENGTALRVEGGSENGIALWVEGKSQCRADVVADVAFQVWNEAPSDPESVALSGYCPNGFAVRGHSESGIGVLGHSESYIGVRGSSKGGGIGVDGISESGAAVHGHAEHGTGVLGTSFDHAGVDGHSPSKDGIGVFGHSESGIGVHAKSESGTALKVEGRSSFSTVGSGVIPRLKKSHSVVLSEAGLVTDKSHISVTLTSNPNVLGGDAAVSFIERDPANNRFAINLTKAVGRDTTFTYFIVEP